VPDYSKGIVYGQTVNPVSPDPFPDQTKAAAVLLGLDSPAPTANFFRLLKFAVDLPFESILFGFRF